MSLFGGFSEPSRRLRKVHIYTFPADMADPESVLGFGIPLLGGLAEPGSRLH